MNLDKFDKKELQIIESYLKSSQKINIIYEKLYQLDINNKKNSIEYQNLIKELQKEINIETQKYQNSNLTTEQNTKIIELISTSNTNKTDSISTIINQYDFDLISRRVFNILTNQIITNIDYTINKKDIQSLEFLNTFELSTNNNTYNEISNYTKIQIAINNDIKLIFLLILQETLNLCKYSKYKNDLLKSLYSTSFINKEIEQELINNNFTLPNNIYLSSKLINDLLKSNNNIYNIITTILVEPLTEQNIFNLLEIKDNEYNNQFINIKAILTECYIRALLTFLNEERIKYQQNKFQHILSNNKYLNNIISIDIINNCFNNIKYDKTKKRTISLTIPK